MISMIIPALDEAQRVQTTLRRALALEGVSEVVLVDGGSRDDTLALAGAVEGVTAIRSPRGRAKQLNAGAAVAKNERLLFAHTDARFPTHAGQLIVEALSDPTLLGGAFRIVTCNDGPPSLIEHLLWIADVRSHYTSVAYGDQGIFVRRAAFEALGGFPDIPLMEDLAFSRRLRAMGRRVTLPAYVRVSGRRFIARPLTTLILVNTFPMLFDLGVPPAWLARLYGMVR